MVRLRAGELVLGTTTAKFQFQYGAIKSTPLSRDQLGFYHFNSNMVRLRVRHCFRQCDSVSNFNSNMVRLRVIRKNIKAKYCFISIPIWCD